jgi:hypothetical protein
LPVNDDDDIPHVVEEFAERAFTGTLYQYLSTNLASSALLLMHASSFTGGWSGYTPFLFPCAQDLIRFRIPVSSVDSQAESEGNVTDFV